MVRPTGAGRLVAQSIERLCRRHRDRTTLHQVVGQQFDVQTGDNSPQSSAYLIAIVATWDATETERFAYDISYLAANKNFTYGGEYQIGDRHMLIPGRVLPDVSWAVGDFSFELAGKKYKIVKYTIFDNNAGAYFYLRKVDNVRLPVTQYRAEVSSVTDEFSS